MTAGKWLKTACNLCYINCGIEVLVNDGRLEKVRGDRSSPKSQGYLCNKATRIPYYAHHKDRLTTPLRRRADGGFDEIEWDVAIAEIAERLRDIVDRYGGKSYRPLRRRRAGQPRRRRLRQRIVARAGFAQRLQRPFAGENRRLLGQWPHVRQPDLPHRRGRASLRSPACHRCKSLDRARLPQCARSSQSNPQGSRTQADRH